MYRGSRKFVRVTKFLLAGVTVFCVSWIACINDWHSGVHWRGRRFVQENPATLPTIVAYSEEKQAELDRPSPVACNRLPAFPNVPHINRTWFRGVQPATWQTVGATPVSLYSAYYDERTSQRYIRILAIYHGRNTSSQKQLYCQTRSMNPNDDSVEVVAAKVLEMWWQDWDKHSLDVETPILLSCPLTKSLSGPLVASIVTQPCDDPFNGFYLRNVELDKQHHKTFTVCVKDLNFESDITSTLIEWIETNKLLGANMIDIYIDSLNNKSEDILLHYRSLGYVRLFQVPVNSKDDRTLWQRRRDHMVTYNDCLYRNIAESKYIVPLDIDEILLPKLTNNWPGLLARLEYQGWNPKKYSAVIVQNVFFFKFVQNFLNYSSNGSINKNKIYIKRDDVRIEKKKQILLQYVQLKKDRTSFKYEFYSRADDNGARLYNNECVKGLPVPKIASHIIGSAIISPVGHYSKSFMLTKRVLTAFNHYPLASIGTAGISAWSAPFNEVQLNHYKESCNVTIMEECEMYAKNTRIDRSAVRLKRPLTRAMAKTLCLKLKKS